MIKYIRRKKIKTPEWSCFGDQLKLPLVFFGVVEFESHFPAASAVNCKLSWFCSECLTVNWRFLTLLLSWDENKAHSSLGGDHFFTAAHSCCVNFASWTISTWKRNLISPLEERKPILSQLTINREWLVFLWDATQPLRVYQSIRSLALYKRVCNKEGVGMEWDWLCRQLKAPVLDNWFTQSPRPVIYGPAQRCSGQQNG